ncbi:MAG: TMEM175 family protein [Solirubrobacteraceae bacterium]
MDKGRLEAFSDGVIAVAITLLVLNITVPDPAALTQFVNGHRVHESLGHALVQKWPEYAAYATSFLTIGIIWINHHAMISRLRAADHAILIINIVLLMTIAVIPFSTSLMATYLRHGDSHLAAAVYGGVMLVMAATFSLLNRQILLARAHLLAQPIPLEERRLIYRRAASGVLPYVVAIALAPLSAYATLILSGALAVFYALPIASSTTSPGRE